MRKCITIDRGVNETDQVEYLSVQISIDYFNEFEILFKFDLFICQTKFKRPFFLSNLNVIEYKILFKFSLIS